MSSITTVLDFLGASGFVAAVGSVFALGRLHQKVEAQAEDIASLGSDHKETSSAHAAMAITLGRMEERMNVIKTDLGEIKEAVRRRPE